MSELDDNLQQLRGYFVPPQLQTATAPNGAAVQIINPDPTRVAILWSAGINFGAMLGNDDTISLSSGIHLAGASAPFLMRYQDVGNLVQLAWFAMSDGPGASQVSFYEIKIQ